MTIRPTSFQFPPPKDWQQFERNMRDLYEAHWTAPAAMHGRTGQPQHGVDIYGQPNGSEHYHGVQCKGHDGNLGAGVTEAELRAEIQKARGFGPRLAHFILATTTARDAKIQAAVRRLNQRKRKPFTVEVMFWDDLVTLYEKHPDVYARHYTLPSLDRLHQLRPPLADFTGRQAELDDFLAHVGQGVTISGVQGMGGIGKTELAYVLADRLKDQYPDAQLYLDLKGTSPEPLPPAEVLSFIIRCFHPEEKLPDDLAQLQALYHSALSDKRVLLLMDNAAQADQLRPASPPPAGSLLLVTSRQHFTLPGLYAKSLETLPPDKARVLLLTICPRIGAVADELARLCAYLPLALRLAASALACSTLSPDEFAARLRDERKRLAELDKGAKAAGEIEVTVSLTLSEALLSDQLRQRWYMLAVFPADFGIAAPASVWQSNHDDAQDALATLHRHSVLDWNPETLRFRLHDLVRTFLRGRVCKAPPPHDQLGAVQRFVEYYTLFAGTADYILEQREGYAAGLRLFDVEWPNIQAAFAAAKDHAADQPWANQAVIELASGCVRCLDLRLYGDAAIAWQTAGLHAARRARNRQAEGALLYNLAHAQVNLGDARKSIASFEQCLEIARQIGDRRSEGVTLGHLGRAHVDLGEARKAIEFYDEQLKIAHEIGDRRDEGSAVCNLASAYFALGDARKAVELYEQFLEIAHKFGDHRAEGAALGNLGNAHLALHDPPKAIEFYEQALTIAREIGDRRGEANALGNLGAAHFALGDPRTANEFHEQRLAIVREIRDQRAEGQALGNIANAHTLLGDTRKAIEFYEQQFKIAHQIGNRTSQAIANWNMGLAYEQLGELARAADLMQLFVDFQREIGHADAEKHAARLAALRARLK